MWLLAESADSDKLCQAAAGQEGSQVKSTLRAGAASKDASW